MNGNSYNRTLEPGFGKTKQSFINIAKPQRIESNMRKVKNIKILNDRNPGYRYQSTSNQIET